jgi:hypothetical protein
MCLPVGENRLDSFRNEDDAPANPHRHRERPCLPLITPISLPPIFQTLTRKRPQLALKFEISWHKSYDYSL